jgi:hypothetical protein
LVHANFESSYDKSPIAGPLYYSKSLINNVETETVHSETSVFKDGSDMNPIVYLRVNKPLKKDAVIPNVLSPEHFYKLDTSHGIEMEIIPNLTYQKNQ